MPFNGSGTFQRLMNWVTDATAGVKVRADRHDTEDDNFAAGLTNCLTRDGQTQPTANIPLNANRLVNVGQPSAAQDAATKKYVDDSVLAKLSIFKRTIFSASSTAFQYDPLTTYADIECQGGGGAGGGTGTGAAAGLASAGSGGGGGGYSKKLIQITAPIRAATKTISVAGGGGGTTGAGASGGTSQYADTVNTLNGQGGAAASPGAWASQVGVRVGGAGGGSAGGDLITVGQSGGQGFSFGSAPVGAAGNAAAAGGNGGASILGAGGTGPVTFTTNATGGGTGNNGYLGGGGAGAIGYNATGSALAGGNGGAGVVIITEYR